MLIIKKKRKTYASHYSGCKNLVDFFVNKKIKSFIQIGSCIEYGFIKSPQKENMESKIENLKSTYGKAKFLATKYLIQKYKDYKFPLYNIKVVSCLWAQTRLQQTYTYSD